MVEHDPELEKTARIAILLRKICNEINNHKGMSFCYITFDYKHFFLCIYYYYFR